mmetsp:Transcript_100968/g.151290  ORF Transcript_100968/g.151290 Transcript_100968/m.151290 type:complete len:162 (-) Transcript_100968:55-540(-)
MELSVRETSFEKQLAYYSRTNETKLVLAFDYSPSLQDDIHITYSGSQALADSVSFLMEEAGYSTRVNRNSKISRLENLLKKENNQPQVLDIQLPTSSVVRHETRKELCAALVNALAHGNVMKFAARKPETLVTIPSDLNLLAENLLKCALPAIPEVQVLRL